MRGARLADDRWEFAGLPLGECRVEVYDGVSTSLPSEVTVRVAAIGVVVATFPSPTGALVMLRDRSGVRVFDADVLLILEEGRTRGAPNLRGATRLQLGPGGPESIVCPLSPGSYRYAVSKRGYGEATGSLTVTSGALARIDCVLKSPEPAEGKTR